MTPPETTPPPAVRPGAYKIVAVLYSAYVVSHFYRSSVGVIGPDLMRGMDLSPEALGTLAGTFFVVFGLAQIPVGVLLDRFGPRRINSLLFVVAALGALIFAGATDAATFTLGRAVMGLGCASALMGSLVVYARWFPPRQFFTLAGLTLGLGGLGGLVATTPLALAAAAVGWRAAFVAAAVVTVLVALMVWFGVRDAPPGHTHHSQPRRESLTQSLKGVGSVLADRRLYFVLPLNSVAYASVMVTLALWGAPYLADVHGLDSVTAADILAAMAIAMMVGSIGYGWLGPRLVSTKPARLSGAAAVAVIYLVLGAAPAVGVGGLAALFCAFGLISAYSVLLLSHVRTLFADHLVGRGLTTANLFSFIGVGIIQAMSGWIVGAWPAAADGARPPEAYQALFWFLAAIVAGAAAVYALARKPR